MAQRPPADLQQKGSYPDNRKHYLQDGMPHVVVRRLVCKLFEAASWFMCKAHGVWLNISTQLACIVKNVGLLQRGERQCLCSAVLCKKHQRLSKLWEGRP